MPAGNLTNLQLQPITPACCRSRYCSSHSGRLLSPSISHCSPARPPGPRSSPPALFMAGGGTRGPSTHCRARQATPPQPPPCSPHAEPWKPLVCVLLCRACAGCSARKHLQIDSTEQGTQESKGPYPVHLLQSPAWRPSVPDRTLALSRAVLEESHFH